MLGSIINQFAWALVVILLILLFFVTIFRARVKGYIGEKTVSTILKILDSNAYKVINDLTINIDRGTSQIDHVIVSKHGIFVIETKNYKGWIFGDDYGKYWTQVIFKRKEKLYNPIKQNYGHIQALRYNLEKEYPSLKYVSIVVFPFRTTLKVKSSNHVVYTINLLKTIKQYKIDNISSKDMNSIYNKLTQLNRTDKESKKEHIRNIKENKMKVIERMSSNICPKCGNSLVSRKGRYGYFKACIGYPKCKYTVS